MTPIDENPSPPPPSGVDINYLTQDIVAGLNRAVLDRVDAVAVQLGVGRRRAALIVMQQLQATPVTGPAPVPAVAADVGPEAPPADASDPLGDFEDETERGLAAVIAKRTGIAPIVVLDVLRFWVRDRDGEPFMRDLDLSEYHPRERVKHALRAAVRIASLDHFGAPLLPWTPDYTVVPPSKSEKAP